ncbi:hypothetical protein PFICI_01999 [Pestalotiopsis fici W106-1]|uniref:Xylanolytic transcriptional activator regulatory domain-containing protein n=1 Tax=Pestalotiopsis fici (strain W106-1 / CGMCC3.15140) TaxID=1229662 RepID=W3XSH5_PESFW|nr:uncharacterized protein PFICI_01999 [Pestalotiopsis fici W106-1]ETS88171.1 hypothetical protein PFICI_01999 [Pestalotiopsis fici W106-1]
MSNPATSSNTDTGWTAPLQSHHSGSAPVDDDDLVGQIAVAAIPSDPFSQTSARSIGTGHSLLRSLLIGPLSELPSSEQRSARHHSFVMDLPYEARADWPPKQTVGRLVDVYFEHCDMFSPILQSKDDFLATIEPLCDGTLPMNHDMAHAKFQAFAIFATAIFLLNRIDSSVPVSRSEAFFANCVQLLSENPGLLCTGDLDHLTNLLLIIQYCFFAAHLTAAWHFIGLATRLAIELDLHISHVRTAHFERVELDRRRWLFWCTYSFERTLCFVVGRPVSISDQSIQAPLPTEVEGDSKRCLAIHLLKGRQIQSDIYNAISQKGSFSGIHADGKSQWRRAMHGRLDEWGSVLPSYWDTSQLAPAELFNAARLNALVLLYYPSFHFPDLSEQELGDLGRFAMESVHSYPQVFRGGKLRFYWRAVHNLFRSGVAVIYCIYVSRMRPCLVLNADELNASINSCSSVLWGMVERYPSGKPYRDIFEKLADQISNPRHNLSSLTENAATGELTGTEGFLDRMYADLQMDIPFALTDVLVNGFVTGIESVSGGAT